MRGGSSSKGVLFPDALQVIDCGGRIGGFVYGSDNTEITDSGIGFNRYRKVVVYEKMCLGSARNGTDGAGDFEYGGLESVFHVQLEVAHTAIDRRLGTGFVARCGIGENQLESKIFFHSYALSHRGKCCKIINWGNFLFVLVSTYWSGKLTFYV